MGELDAVFGGYAFGFNTGTALFELPYALCQRREFAQNVLFLILVLVYFDV